jgi:lactate dehydrogenase-like 2-hydroxyacid dehydrogenase
MGGATDQAFEAMIDRTLDNIRRHLAGRPLRNRLV